MRMQMPAHRQFRSLDEFDALDRIRRHVAPKAMLPGLAPLVMGGGAAPGYTRYTGSGTKSFVVPDFDVLLEVEFWGSGGQSGWGGGGNGGATYCTSLGMTAGGGVGNNSAVVYTAGKAGGTATGGDYNLSGNPGSAGWDPGYSAPGAAGGAARSGLYGDAYGAGGQGRGSSYWQSGEDSGYSVVEGGMGGGGYTRKSISAGVLVPGSVLTIILASGGMNNGGARLTWR